MRTFIRHAWLPFTEALESVISGEVYDGLLAGLPATDTGGSCMTDRPQRQVILRSWGRQPVACPLGPGMYVWGTRAEVGGEGGEVGGVGGEDAVVEAEGEGHDMGVDYVFRLRRRQRFRGLCGVASVGSTSPFSSMIFSHLRTDCREIPSFSASLPVERGLSTSSSVIWLRVDFESSRRRPWGDGGRSGEAPASLLGR